MTSRIAKKSARRGDAAARARFVATHWGLRGKGRARDLRCADPTQGTLTELGELVAVVYLTEKAGDGLSEYTHRFKRGQRPVLAFTDLGRHSLVIAGGGYRMRVGGIDG